MSENSPGDLDLTASASETARLYDEISQLEEEIHNARKNKGGLSIDSDSWVELISIVVLGFMALSFSDTFLFVCTIGISALILWLVIVFRRSNQKNKDHQEVIALLEAKLADKKLELINQPSIFEKVN